MQEAQCDWGTLVEMTTHAGTFEEVIRDTRENVIRKLYEWGCVKAEILFGDNKYMHLERYEGGFLCLAGTTFGTEGTFLHVSPHSIQVSRYHGGM